MTTLLTKWTESPLVRLSTDTVYLLTARIISQALTLLFTLAVARTLGEQGFGQFAFISAVIAIANVVTTFGMDTMLIRDVAAARPPSTAPTGLFSAALFIQLGLSTVVIGVLVALGPRLPNQTATQPALLVAALSLFPLAFSTVFSALLRGRGQMGTFALFSGATAAILGLGAWLLWRRGGALLIDVALILLAAQAGGAIVAFLLYRRAWPLTGRWRWPTRRQLDRAWRIGSVLAGLMILAVLYQRLDVLLLSLLAGDAATGYYAAAVRILEALKMLPGAFFGALLPLLVAGERPDVRSAYRRSFAYLMGLSVVLAALTAGLAGPLVGWLFGPGFEPAVIPLRLISWSLPLTVVTFKLSFDLVAKGQERLAGLSMLLTLLVAFPITYLLIARWSLLGAAVALLVCEAAQIAILFAVTAAHKRA